MAKKPSFSWLIFQIRKFYRLTRRLTIRAISEPVPAHNIAMGFAMGVFFAVGPSFGFQLIPFLFFAIRFKYSKLAGLIPILATNPLVIIPLYAFYLSLGKFLLGDLVDVDVVLFQTTLKRMITDFEFKSFFVLGQDTLIAFLTGSLLVASISSVLTYFFTKPLVEKWKNRKHKGEWWRKRAEGLKEIKEKMPTNLKLPKKIKERFTHQVQPDSGDSSKEKPLSNPQKPKSKPSPTEGDAKVSNKP